MQVPFLVILARQSSHFPTWASASGTSRCIFSQSAAYKILEKGSAVCFARLFVSCWKLQLYKMEIHQKKAGPDYHRLKTIVKRSIEQNLRKKNFETRNGNFETSAVVKNYGTNQCGSLGDCWQWKAKGQCLKGDNSNTVLSFSDSRIINLYKLSKMSSDGICVINIKKSSHFESNS